jgi:hypothetical protein
LSKFPPQELLFRRGLPTIWNYATALTGLKPSLPKILPLCDTRCLQKSQPERLAS